MAVTAKMICVFVFAYAKCWFSHDAAHTFFQFHHSAYALSNPKLNALSKIIASRFSLVKMSRVVRKPFFAYSKTKTQISFAVTAKLINAFVFATQIDNPSTS